MSKVKLKDVVMRVQDKTNKDTTDLEFYVGGEHIESGEICVAKKGVIKGSTIGPAFKMAFKSGDVLLMSRNPHLKKASVVDFDGICSDVSYVCRSRDESVLLQSYLPFVLQSDDFWRFAEENKKGGLPFFLNWSDFERYEFELPTIEKQKELSDILWAMENTKKAYRELLKKTDELVKSQFIEMFGDVIINDKKWKSGTLGDYFQVKGGKRIPKGMTFSSDVTKHPYLRTTDMKDGTIIDDDIHYIDDEVFSHISRYVVAGGDIYLTNVGVNLGMAGIIPEKYDGANLTENAVKLIPKTKELLSEFLSQYINMPQAQQYIEERKMAVGVPKLAIFRIESMPIIIPSKDLQLRFIDIVHQSDKSKFNVQIAIYRDVW